MKGKGIWRVTEAGLVPADDEARECMAALKAGQRVFADVHRPRNIDHHRWFFALLHKIAEAKGETPETVLTWLKVAMGRVDFVRLPSGKVVAAPQSVAFASMDQREFARFTDEAVRLVCQHILPGVSDAALRAEVDEMLGNGRAAA